MRVCAPLPLCDVRRVRSLAVSVLPFSKTMGRAGAERGFGDLVSEGLGWAASYAGTRSVS